MTQRGIRTAILVALLAAGATCADERQAELTPQLPGGGDDDMALATRWLEAEAPLPTRAEVVAVTDRLSIAAGKAAAEAPAAEASGRIEPARMKFIAARLRERIWRLEGTKTDGREAIELYQQVVAMKDEALTCEADWRRARIVGEVSADPAAAYRELFLATERQSTRAESAEAEACLSRLRDMMARVEPFRPTGSAWQALQREGAELASTRAPGAAASAEDPTAPASSAAPKAGFTGDEIVVKPDPSMLGKERPTLTSIQPYSWQQGGRIVLELTGAATYATGILKPDPKTGKGHRIFVDVENVAVKGKKHRTIEAKGIIERVRMAKRGNGIRIVLDLSEAVHRRVFYLPNPFRVMIDVGTRVSPKQAKAKPLPKGQRLVRRVALDPGHGGWDAGAVGPTGLMEKNVALDVAHRAAPALASELGIETMLTRDTDAFIDLEERTARANAFQSDIFISIHCNATENGEAHGHEIFILDPSREGDRRAYAAMARENRSRRGATLDPSMMDAQVSSIQSALGLGALPKRSRMFAGLLQKSMNASVAVRYPSQDHGVKTAGFYVLVGAQMPAVLFETAFISNTDDEARLGTADFRQKLADAIVNAVRAYRDGL